MVKTCTLCGQKRPLDDFPRDKRRSDGRGSHCGHCRSTRYPAKPETTAAYREANRARLLEKQTARHRLHRERLTALKLTLSCVDCGWQPSAPEETRRLDFDHVDPDTKHRIGAGAVFPSWSWERIERELALCEPRCKPCHAVRTGVERHNLRRRSAS